MQCGVECDTIWNEVEYGVLVVMWKDDSNMLQVVVVHCGVSI